MRWTIAPSAALGLPRRSCEASGSSSIRSSSMASRSAVVTGAANGSTPASIASSRSRRAQNAWNVVTESASNCAGIRVSIRSRSASAAAGENVRTRMASAGVPWATSHAKRSTSTWVLPAPAPASTSSGPPGCATASCCAGVVSVTRGTFVGYGR